MRPMPRRVSFPAFATVCIFALVAALPCHAKDRAPENQIRFTEQKVTWPEPIGVGTIASDGEVVFLGNASRGNTNPASPGMVRMLSREGTSWTQQACLRYPLPEPDGLTYGEQVAATSSTLVVAVHDENQVLVYENTGSSWTLATTIGPGPDAAIAFGSAVAIDGDTLAIACTADEPDESSLWLYRRGPAAWELVTSHTVTLHRPSGVEFAIVLDVVGMGSSTLVACADLETSVFDADSSFNVAVYGVSGTSWSLRRQVTRTFTATGSTSTNANYADWYMGPWMAMEKSDDLVALLVGTFPADGPGASRTGRAEVHVCEGTSWTLEATLHPSDPMAGALFGASVSLKDTGEGLVALVGAPRSDNGLLVTGASYVLRRESGGVWSELAKLVPGDGCDTDCFGIVTQLTETPSGVTAWAWVSPLLASNWQQAWYAYDLDFSGPPAEDPATADSPHERDNVGYAVDISGDWAAVASPLDDEAAHDAGAVYVYRRTGDAWSSTQKLMAPDAGANDSFGSALSLDGDILAVGTWNHHGVFYSPSESGGTVSGNGKVTVWRRSGDVWQHEHTFEPAAPDQPQEFGQAVDVSGDLLIVGAQGEPAAHLYRYTSGTWTSETVITEASVAGSHSLGRAVAVCATEEHDYAFVGWVADGSYAAKVDIYREDSGVWSLVDTVGGPSDSAGVLFSLDTCIDANGLPVLIIGAHQVGWRDDFGLVFQTTDGAAWRQAAILEATGSEGNSRTMSAALASGPDGFLAIVGAYSLHHPDTYEAAGGAYVYFNRDRAWALQQAIQNPSPHRGDVFGQAVAIDYDGTRCTAVVGAPGDDSVATNGGAAYFFEIDLAGMTFPPFLETAQSVAIQSDGSYWCGAWDYTAGAWNATRSGSGPGAIDLSLYAGRWISAYLYDYASATYTEGAHFYIDSTLD